VSVQLVWFKKDLRVEDHRPLAEAAAGGPVLPLFVVEDEVAGAPDFSAWHWEFAATGLRELREELARRGQPLVVRRGHVVEIFEEWRRTLGVECIWAHEETGNGVTYARDRAVRRWARESAVAIREYPQTGVIRGLQSRDGWSRRWEARMSEPWIPAPGRLQGVPGVELGTIPEARELGLAEMPPLGEAGTRREGLRRLGSFLGGRGLRYRWEMSSPVTALESCSRLSAHLAWGQLSMKEVAQAVRRRREEVKGRKDDESKLWRQSLASFDARLHWHCHFQQKLEDAPRTEYENMARAYDGLRESEWNEDRFAAWREGRTGYPFVDACMRSLRATGWINFRMRAMLMSFAAYDLWLHWREPALEMARLFVDYEPGIHYSQAQMQSGTTGINTVRIYSPVKQGYDQDPSGEFVRRWVPELRDVPAEWVQEPWNWGRRVQGYPDRIVFHEEAAARARARIAEVRRRTESREEAREVARRHGSRKKRARAGG
jgi:deoxyribodipyrimidine photo-lyase